MGFHQDTALRVCAVVGFISYKANGFVGVIE